VKHAANESSPLLTAEQRVDQAITSLSMGRAFSTEQMEWLGRIRNHLVENLSIDPDDFELPIFARYGGRSRAKKVFGSEFDELLATINERVAA
jgi:type I restriction enzyme, R subunit